MISVSMLKDLFDEWKDSRYMYPAIGIRIEQSMFFRIYAISLMGLFILLALMITLPIDMIIIIFRNFWKIFKLLHDTE